MSSLIESLAEKTFDSFKKITPALVAIAILTGSILFLPESVLEKMELNDLPDIWKRVIGISFLLSVALIGTIIIYSLFSSFFSKRRNRKFKENMRKKLLTLSPRQKDIIISALNSDDKTIQLDSRSGDTLYLMNNLFLHMPQQIVSTGLGDEIYVTYVPQPWLLELYNEEPILFE